MQRATGLGRHQCCVVRRGEAGQDGRKLNAVRRRHGVDDLERERIEDVRREGYDARLVAVLDLAPQVRAPCIPAAFGIAAVELVGGVLRSAQVGTVDRSGEDRVALPAELVPMGWRERQSAALTL
jgi:hypothetical protein